jgi:hypothetical protein
MSTIFWSGSGKYSDPIRPVPDGFDDGAGFDELRSPFNKIERMNETIAARFQHDMVRPPKSSFPIVAPDPAGQIAHQPLGHGAIDHGALSGRGPCLADPASRAGKAMTAAFAPLRRGWRTSASLLRL